MFSNTVLMEKSSSHHLHCSKWIVAYHYTIESQRFKEIKSVADPHRFEMLLKHSHILWYIFVNLSMGRVVGSQHFNITQFDNLHNQNDCMHVCELLSYIKCRYIESNFMQILKLLIIENWCWYLKSRERVSSCCEQIEESWTARKSSFKNPQHTLPFEC